MDHSAFCKNCCEIMPFSIEQETVYDATKDVKFAYTKKTCLCKKCGNEVYIFDIANENIEAYFAAYYAAKDALIPSQEIHAQ